MAFKNMEELEQAIASSGQNWSDADKALANKDISYGNSIYTLKNDWINAMKNGDTTAAKDIHDRTEDFRKRYGGYSGGADGSEYIKDGTYFNYDDPYKDTLNNLTDKLLGYGEFENPYGDALFNSANKLTEYGQFTNPYQDDIDRLSGQIGAYDKFQNPYQEKIENAAEKLGNYGAYENPYQQKTDDLLNEYLGRGPFSYNLDTDPIWQQYQKTYLREGQRAREDALGNYSAATGGQTSTAAMQAASQAQDYYAAQMSDKIPELYKLAYDMWLDEGDQYAKQLSTLRGLNSDALSAWSANRSLLDDQLSAWRSLGKDALNEWNANFNLLNDQLSAYRGLGNDALSEWGANLNLLKEQTAAYQGLSDNALKAWNANLGLLDDQISTVRDMSDNLYDQAYKKWSSDYQVGRDSISDTRYEDETAYDRAQDDYQKQYQAQQDALNKALMWMKMGLIPDSNVANQAGLSDAEVQAYVNAIKAQTAAKSSGSSSGSRGSSGSSSASASSGTNVEGSLYDVLFENGLNDYGNAYEYLRKAGYSTTDANRYAEYFAESYYPKMHIKQLTDGLILSAENLFAN